MSDAKAHPPLTYEGGFDEVVERFEARRSPLSFAHGEALPPLDVDFGTLKQRNLKIAKPVPRAKDRSGHMRKWLELAEDFEGQPELLHLHGLLIAHLRKSDQPPHTMALFTRIWAEEADWLLAHLDPRWLVSAITAFGDCGTTEVQRRVGSALSVLFNTMKLYESERLYSGFGPDQAFKLKRHVARPLPLQMDRFALLSGGLDVNMLARLWIEAGEDEVFAPLARHVLTLLNGDDGTVFRRLATLRGRKLRQQAIRLAELEAPGPTWGVVSTFKGHAADLRRFAEHHLAMGAAQVTVHLDAPLTENDPPLELPGLELVVCDAEYWKRENRYRPKRLEQRQLVNASRVYALGAQDWLCHIDGDEFLHSDRPITTLLDETPAEHDALIIPPAEEIESAPGAPLLFRRLYSDVGCERKVLDQLYPTFGRYLKGGFISHTEGKSIARTGRKGALLGVHHLKLPEPQQISDPRTSGAVVLHRHAPSWAEFERHLSYRRELGSYKPRKDGGLGLGEILEVITDEAGQDGLRQLYDEMCTIDTDKRALMQAHGLLIETHLRRLPDAGDE